jgi:hypothetical protein
VDFVLLTGTSALEIWRGSIPSGEYNKAFLYVEEAWGVLATGEDVGLTLPSSKFQISKPLGVSEGMATSFVYDTTVVTTGNKESAVGTSSNPTSPKAGRTRSSKSLTGETVTMDSDSCS